MQKQFEYLARKVVDAEIEVSDIGNCSLLANNDVGQQWAIITKTDLGWCEVFEAGPINIDIEQLPEEYTSTYKRFAYSEQKLAKAIDNFLNAPKRLITQAQEVQVEEATYVFRNVADYIWTDNT